MFNKEIPVMFTVNGVLIHTVNTTGGNTSEVIDLTAFRRKSLFIRTTGATGHNGAATVIQPVCFSSDQYQEDGTPLLFDAMSAPTAAGVEHKTVRFLKQNQGGAVPLEIDLSELPLNGLKFLVNSGDGSHAVALTMTVMAEEVG
jgi:hypothetical protein